MKYLLPWPFSCVASFILISGSSGAASLNSDYSDSLAVESGKSFTRFKLALDPSFNPVIQESTEGFKMTIPAASLMDIGIPFGSEDAFNRYLSLIHDTRLDHLQVHESEGQLQVTGKFHYPTGSSALAKPKMEHFDFRRDEQGRYVVDFFYSKGPTIVEAAYGKKVGETKLAQAEVNRLQQKESDRKASRLKRLEVAKNALLFCELPVDRTNTIFLKYRVDRTSLNFNAYFPEKIPDHLFEYAEPKSSNEESEMVKLALKLARENKEALSVKTIEFLEKEYPKSKFINEMLFLKANDYYRLGFEDKGKSMLQDLSKKARGSEVGLQSAAFLAVQSFKNQEWLAAMESFLNLKREMPNHRLNWLFRYGIAECLYHIKQTDQAKHEYEWVAANAPKREVAAEAAFKIGDLYLDRNQYAQAVTYYESAIKKYPTFVGQYPQVVMNLSEAYFQLEELARAETYFLKYQDLGRSQPAAWRASLRLAEIKLLNRKSPGEVEKAFTETINRYPMSPGAVVARIRMLPCGNHGGMDLANAERLLGSPEVKNFDGDGSVFAGPFIELVALTDVRSLISFGEDEKAVKQGIAHLRENPSVEVRKLIEQAMIGGIKRILDKELTAGDVITAIATYEKYGDFLPLPLHDPMADDLKLKLAKAASERKLATLALKIIEPYKRMNEESAKEVVAAIERNLSLEGADEQEERNLIEAKTLWNNSDFKNNKESSERFLTRISALRDGSPSEFERDLMAALFYSETEDFAKANSLLRKLTTRMSKISQKAKIQVWTFAGETANSTQDLDFAQKSFHLAKLIRSKPLNKAEEELTFRHLNSVPTLGYLYQMEGESLEKQQKWKEAVALYTEAIENKVGNNHILYALAQAVLKEGSKNSKKIASRSFEKIQQSQEDDVWKRLARDRLDEIAKEGKVDDEKRK